MNRRLKREIRACAIIASIAALLGAIFGIAIAVSGDGETRFATVAAAAFRGVWTGGFIASLLVAIESFYINGANGAWMRRLSFSAQLLLRSLLYLVIILAGIQSGAALFPVTASTPFGWNSETAIQLGFSLVISLAVNFAMSVNRLLGQAVFRNFLTGRYHRQVVEPRVLLFVDLVGSTAAAQAIGDLAFHGLLRDVYRDLTGPVIERRGVIEKYVGDEMIVSWPDRPDARLAALRCGLDFQQVLDQVADRYRRTYGLAPRLRGAVHAGPVVMGEMGELRQEIVMLLMCGVFLMEILSVVIQVGCFRLTGGKRVFRCAPFHHHLHLPAAITQIDKNHPAVVATAVHPATQCDGFINVGGVEDTAIVAAHGSVFRLGMLLRPLAGNQADFLLSVFLLSDDLLSDDLLLFESLALSPPEPPLSPLSPPAMFFLLPVLKSVSYQPPPFRRKAAAEIFFFRAALPHSGQSTRGSSAIFCSASSS
mgnify:CR=1 FL=1